MSAKEIIIGVVILVLAMTIFSYIFYPEVRQQTNTFFTDMGSKVQEVGTSQSQTESVFRCEEQLKDWIKTERIKLPSSVSIKTVEKRSFTNKSELLAYKDKWNAYNEYDIEKRIGEITKLPEPRGEHNLRQEDKVFILDFDYNEEDVNYAGLIVKKGFFDKEVVCDKKSDSPKGTLKCDVSENGNGTYEASAYIDTIDKVWEGRLDVALIKSEGETSSYGGTILMIGLCEEEGKLSFG